MKHVLYIISILLIGDLFLTNCANPGRPTGGPKDTIPPTLIYSSPTNGTTNFSNSTIEFEFSEYINADKLKQQLIITPNSDIKYKSIIKRNKLVLKLEGDLQDTTTYNFNFANGVTDITEKNPVINLSLAFSTGPYIDSMSISGSVENLLTKEPGKGYVVGLYPLSDSLDFFTQKPMYFTSANDSGNYKIKYIKTGKYKIISFEDDNGNYLLDPDIEPHGFLSDTIALDSATSLPPIRCLLQNVKPLVLINARPTGRYVEIKFNKQVDFYDITPQTPSNIIGENKDIIRLYKPEAVNYGDSITSYITSSDSLNNTIQDTIKYVFLESNRKPAGFSYSFSKNTIDIKDNPELNLSFNKPIQTFDTTLILLKVDSTYSSIPSFTKQWNQNRTELQLDLKLKSAFVDSLLEAITIADTLIKDSTSSSKNKKRVLTFNAIKGAFISVENDTTELKNANFKKPQESPKGVLKVTLNTTETHFWFQLLDKNQKVLYQKANETSFSFSAIKPGTYSIRMLIDTNKDGKWSYGNLLNNEEPEEVVIYGEPTSIRENWVVELDINI